VGSYLGAAGASGSPYYTNLLRPSTRPEIGEDIGHRMTPPEDAVTYPVMVAAYALGHE